MRVMCNTNHILLVNLGKVKHSVRVHRSIKNHSEEASRAEWERVRVNLPLFTKGIKLKPASERAKHTHSVYPKQCFS